LSDVGLEDIPLLLGERLIEVEIQLLQAGSATHDDHLFFKRAVRARFKSDFRARSLTRMASEASW
jgi:hypothetical protein